KDAGPVLGAGGDHVAMPVEPAIRHTDNLWPLLGQHLPIIRVAVLRFEPLHGSSAALGVVVGHCHNLDILDRLPDDIESVAIVPLAGSPNHGDAISLCHVISSVRFVPRAKLSGSSVQRITVR